LYSMRPNAHSKKHVLIGGGTGLIGSALCKRLSEQHNVAIVSRNPPKNELAVYRHFPWSDLSNGLPKEPKFDAIVNVSGANVMQKSWSEKRKLELLESRVGTTNALVNAIKKSSYQPQVFVSGSAVGYYPTSQTKDFSDLYNEPPADNFAGQLCHQWEQALFQGLECMENVRKVAMRTGVVLSPQGGVLRDMSRVFKLYLGGSIGSGEQFMPWIHVNDLVNAFAFIIENDKIEGPVNAVAPELTTNAEFTKELSRSLGKPAWFTLPARFMQFILGERHYLVTKGQRVMPEKLLKNGFTFQFPDLTKAMNDSLV